MGKFACPTDSNPYFNQTFLPLMDQLKFGNRVDTKLRDSPSVPWKSIFREFPLLKNVIFKKFEWKSPFKRNVIL
jgi:hypothetical protein